MLAHFVAAWFRSTSMKQIQRLHAQACGFNGTGNVAWKLRRPFADDAGQASAP